MKYRIWNEQPESEYHGFMPPVFNSRAEAEEYKDELEQDAIERSLYIQNQYEVRKIDTE